MYLFDEIVPRALQHWISAFIKKLSNVYNTQYCNNPTFYTIFCSYLGQGQEITGRTILDEDLVQEIAIISRPGIILMPGQTLPMNFFRKCHLQY